MPIRFFYDDVKFRLRRSKMLKDYLSSKIEVDKYSVGDIIYIFVSDATMLEINKQYLQHDYFTDIVTFDYNNLNTVNGEIYISIDTVMSNSLIYNVSFKSELFRVIVHGILHLTGFDDTSEMDKIIMRSEEDNRINEFLEIYGRFNF